MNFRQKHYLRALAVVGGVLLAFSIFLSPLYAMPALAAAASVIFADTRQSSLIRGVTAVVPAVAMIAAIVLFVLHGHLLGLPGATLLLASAVWVMIRHRVLGAQNATEA